MKLLSRIRPLIRMAQAWTSPVLVLVALLLVGNVRGQLTVAPQGNIQQLASTITGAGVTISNPTLNCHGQGYGTYSYSGTGMDLSAGLILTSGRITDAIGPNNNTGSTNSFQQNTPGDALLDAVTGRSTRDACKFEFDVIPSGDTLEFDFTFGSEEYNEWVGSQYNDVFGFFISGPGIAGDPGAGAYHNIARVPGSNAAVTINNVNNGSNQAYYQDNTGGSQSQYDGYTKNLTAIALVQPCQSYHLKLMVADATDRKYDSGVFIERIQSPSISMNTVTMIGLPQMIEGCNAGFVHFERDLVEPTPLTLTYYLTGSAVNGTDYAAIGNVNPAVPKTITIPANGAYVDQPFTPIADGLNEGAENVRCILGNPNCPSMAVDSVIFTILDSLPATCSPGGTICQGGSWPFTVTGGVSYSWSPAAGLSCTTCPNPVASPASTTTYTLTVSHGTCSRTFTRQVRVSQLALGTIVTHPLCQGGTNGAINLSVSNGIPPYSYSWTGPGGFTASTEDITNLIAGTYSVTVTDAACTRTQSWNVIAPPALTVSLNPAMLPFGQNIACHGGATGSISSIITGGTPPYGISWTGPGGYASGNANISGLVAGTYTINIIDAHGCSTSASRTLVASPAISFSASTTANVLCFGTNSGAASSSVSGGIPPYSFTWNSSPVQNTQNAGGLAPGSYTVTLVDAYNCTATASVTISGPSAALSTTLTAQTNVLCSGNNTGSATISITGGTAPYATSWNTTPVQSGTSATNLPAGSWTATVTDANGCQTTRNVTITQPATALTAALFSQNNILCFGNSSGSATVSASGGTGPYTYQWNTVPVQNSATASNLPAGSYTCTVRDVNLCATTVNVTITQPAATLGTSIAAQTNVLCFGNSTGSAEITASGGTAPYAYSWNTSPVQNVSSATNLGAGTWTCTVTDAQGCSTMSNVAITQPASALSVSLSGIQNVIHCQGNGDQNGSATAVPAGGTGLYLFSWNTFPAQSTASASFDAGGLFTVTVTDGNACTAQASVTVDQPGTTSVQVSSQTDVSCFGQSTGGVTVSVSGGSHIQSAQWNTVPVQTGIDLINVPAGSYTGVFQHADGCETIVNVTIDEPTAPVAPVIGAQTDVLIFGESTGSATISTNGGTAPYTYLWSDGQNTATATGLSAGTHTVLVTDANGCSTSTNVTITQPGSALTVNLSALTNVACHGASTGSATADASGGVGPYSYVWNTVPSQSGPTATGLSAGPWICTVTDDNGASTTIGVIISQPTTELTASEQSMTAVACNGGSTGSASVIASGGTPGYTMSWNSSPLQTGPSATGLPVGTFTCTVTDANGCSTFQDMTIGEASALAANISALSDVACFGTYTGSATVLASGGTGPYTYQWTSSPTQTGATATNLPAGTWDCTVTDANGCSIIISAVITQPDAQLVASTNNTSQATCGQDNGTATAEVSGGTFPYTYSWDSSPAQTDSVLQGVGSDIYVCTIIDANGCATSTMATISSPAALTLALVGTTGQSCFGTANGQATVAASGGNGPYSITWNTVPPQNGATASGLIAGNYVATVTDADGCTASVNVLIDGPVSPLSLSVNSTTDVLCFGGNTGEATVSASGGLAPYAITWNTTPAQNGPIATNLTAGTHTATVTDAFGCAASINAIVQQPVAPVDGYVEALQNVSCFAGNDGFATVEATGGSGSWTITWNTTPLQSGATATGLSAGIYFVTISDNNGCDVPKLVPVTISEPSAALSLSATTSDHNGYGVSCAGGTNGSIGVTTTGGTPGYAFVWTGPNGFTSNSEDITGLAAGSYTLLATDANGCTASLTIVLSAPPTINASASITTVACNGTNTGAIDLTASGGVAAYSYAWTGPNSFSAPSEDVTNIGPGVYSVTVSDANGCSAEFPFSVSEPGVFDISATLSVYTGGSNVSCAMSSDGTIDVSVTGGTAPYAYAWTGPNGYSSNTEDITALNAGAYSLDLTDANGCGTLAQYTLSAPDELFTTITPTTYPGGASMSCAGATDGMIDLTISGGTPAYVISWAGPNGFTASAEDISGLAPGNYTVGITDDNGCGTSQSVTLTTPVALDVSLAVSEYNSGDAVSCNGGSNGIIDLTISAGLSPYSASWSGPNGFTSTDIDIGGLSAGTYNVVVSDASGCDTTLTVTLTEPPPALAGGTTTNFSGFELSCHGATDGSIDITPSGGAGYFTYLWTGPNAFVSNAEDVSGLEAGIYDVIVNDMNGCKVLLNFTLDAPPTLGAAAAITSADCQGSNDGAIDLTISGGIPAYTIQWNGPGGFNSTAEDLGSLFAGIYTASIVDANGCTFSQPFDVSQPGQFIITGTTTTWPGGYGVSCAGANDGGIDVTASGGTAPLYFSWQGPNGATAITEDISGIEAGIYNLTLTDANGCSQLQSWTITSPTPIQIGLSPSQFADGSNVACAGGTNASIDAAIIGGVAPYSINWTGPGGFVSISEDITGLQAGIYTLAVTDAIGCTSTSSITLNEPTPISISVTTTQYVGGGNVSCNGSFDGGIDLSLSGGSLIYLIHWTGPNGFVSNNVDITGLAAGNYTVTVTDANGCTANASVNLIQPDPILIDLEISQFGGGYAIGCNGSTGSVESFVQGGSIPWTCLWTGPAGFTSSATNLSGVPAGTYDLLVTNAAGCTAIASATLTEPTAMDLTATLSNVGNGYQVGCTGDDGSITLELDGGISPYITDWSGPNGFASLSEDLNGLGAGTYNVTVIDVNGCQLQQSFTLSQAAPVTLTSVITGNICDGLDDGAIDLTIAGGVSPFAISWNGPDAFSSANEDVNALAGGSYTADVTDANGCTAQHVATIAASDPIQLDLYLSDYGGVNIPCFGASTGVIEATINGGAGSLDILWTGPAGFSSTAPHLSGLAAGNYHLTITDDNSCSLDTTLTLTEPATPIDASFDATVQASGSNVSCFGGNDGSVDLTISGGTGPYAISWHGPGGISFDTEDITTAVAGYYELVVSDTHGCSLMDSITLTGPDTALTVNIGLSQYNGGFNTSCDGTSDGGIDLSASGGSGPYQYAWSGPNGFTSSAGSISGLAEGTYVLMVTDENGCIFNDSVDLIAPDPITWSFDPGTFPSGTNISCHGMGDGSISTSVGGGAGTYEVQWTGPNGFSAADPMLAGLFAGEYCATMIDANGCSISDCVTLSEPDTLTVSASEGQAACGQSNGSIDASTAGGNAPFTYAWSGGQETEDISGLSTGSYALIVTDANGCVASTEAQVQGGPALILDWAMTNVLCHGGSDGSIDLTVESGTSPFSFDWTGTSSGEDLTGVPAGGYQVTVTDANNCTWNEVFNIQEPDAIIADSDLSDHGDGHEVSAFGANDGSIALSVSGGTSPYSFDWSTGGNTPELSGLNAGAYAVTITDANGCSMQLTFELSQPSTLEMPTGFTPNGDGQNDAFVIHGIDIHRDNQLIVFNRWGNVVFEQINYNNGWQGENQEGEQLPGGTYFVLLRLGSEDLNLQGYVDLRR